eukprot:TRINITY_DN2641_c0_g1_i1.p1 TRINITY_DN2641_c0_g1~~TRINITY_DN2641_c0_g1_i1.p1  ORF type:complete len:178 (-),score=56.26 TRINITY_DN2641_c0_g1_i1:239-772(-)
MTTAEAAEVGTGAVALTGDQEKENGDEQAAALKLKEEGNVMYKVGSFLKAAALYTQAIKLDPNNHTLHSNRSAAFLQLYKYPKALADADETIRLNPTWDKGYFRRGSVLEALKRYDEALGAFQEAAMKNPGNSEVTQKIKQLTRLAREQKRTEEKMMQEGKSGISSSKQSEGEEEKK